jgi:hypothetical protein
MSVPLPKRQLRLVARRPGNAPTAAAVERERAMWGPNPDRSLGAIEEAFYQVGFQFLAYLYAAILGVTPPRQLRKALGPIKESVPPIPKNEWGAVARAYQKGGNPLEMRNEWDKLIDRLVGRLFNQETQEQAAAAMAVRAHWLGRIRARTEEAAREVPDSWGQAWNLADRTQRNAMEWTKAHALEGCRDLSENARQGLMNVLIQSKEAGEGAQALGRRCFDTFADLNRDWRRLALTETAAAHANGQLASVDPSEGWEAVWVSAAGACPWCAQWNGRVFRVVSADAPHKDGETEIWVGKTNIGRSGAAKTRDGHLRTAAQLWWPAFPCHPNCSCTPVLRRIKKPLRGGMAA